MNQETYYQYLIKEFESKLERSLKKEELQFINWLAEEHSKKIEDRTS
ncbi:hypothetical protein [Halobacillus naozhouensis]|uniref:Fur-regulated basic protein A n=1 Tax=Halobacillus naozhouensis TaxID=554880 RepID=A0ABY8J133_9BACI|nr:hypothetical protein [Halobacillus naozhouensis]WFT75129.1 hypothetical protein P9989_01595 [Halobacillus naozhouensis]